MREYDDDDIRLYTPVLQRIIILAAVIIAVPVVVWTITTFVRTYVAPPRVPALQQVTENEPSADATPDLPAAAPISAPAAGSPQASAGAPAPQMVDAAASTGETRTPLLEIKKPLAGAEPQSAAPANVAAPAIATSAPPAAMQPSVPAPAVIQPMPTAPAQPGAGLAPAAAAAPATPAASDHEIVWPNPQASTLPDIGATAASANDRASASPQASPGDSATEELPAANPITGPIPLPRRRPNDVAMLQPGSQGAVPLPRARPSDAPAQTSAPTSDNPVSGYDPAMGHY